MLKKLAAKVDAKVASYYFGFVTMLLGPVEEMYSGIVTNFDLWQIVALVFIGTLSFAGMNLLNKSLKFGNAGTITLMSYG